MSKDNYPLLSSRSVRQTDTKVSISYDHKSQRGVYQTMTIDKFATQYGVSSYEEIEELIRENTPLPVRGEYQQSLRKEKQRQHLEDRLKAVEKQRDTQPFKMLLSGVIIAGIINILIVIISNLLFRQ